MATVNRPFVLAVFKDDNQSQKAMQDLMNSGFSRDQIRYSARRGGGGIADDLVSMGIPQQEADYYNNEFEQGHIIVSVRTDKQQQAYNLLRQDGAYDFNSSQGQETSYGTGPVTNATTANASNVAATAASVATNATAAYMPDTSRGERQIELRTEQLMPETRWVQAGEVDLTKQVISEQRTIDVPVTHEEVVIERHPVTDQGQVSDTPIQAADNEIIRIPVSEEQVNIEKQTVVTGEVTVGKRKVQEMEHFTDTVRREELQVNREGDVDVEDANLQQNPRNPGQSVS